MKPVVVIGLGNPLMRDEGVGPAVVQGLERRAPQFPNVEILDAGTSLMAAVHRLAGRKKAVFVDCAVMGTAPGTLRRFTADEVRSVKKLGGFSLHEGDLISALELARRLGECPPEVVVFGIEPFVVETGEGLSAPLRSRLDEYVQAVASELAEAD